MDNLSKLKSEIASKVFYLQISDGSRNASSEGLKAEAEKEGIDVLYAWSNAWRPLPFMNETLHEDEVSEAGGAKSDGYGGFLPVLDVIRAIEATGWEGPWSYEVRC